MRPLLAIPVALILGGCALPRTAVLEGAIRPDQCALAMDGQRSGASRPSLALIGSHYEGALSATISCAGDVSGPSSSYHLFVLVDGIAPDSMTYRDASGPRVHGALRAGEYPVYFGYETRAGAAQVRLTWTPEMGESSCWSSDEGQLEVLRRAEEVRDLDIRFRVRAKRRMCW